VDASITGLNVAGKVFTDKAIEERTKDVLLEIPTIDRPPDIIGNCPNLTV